MNMSYKEKSLLASLGATLLVFGWYLYGAFSNLSLNPEPPRLGQIIILIVLVIISEGIIQSFLALKNKSPLEDERDKLIERISYRFSYGFLSVCIWYLMVEILLDNWFVDLKASSLYRVEAPNEEIKSLLIESKQHYEEKIVQFEGENVSVKSVTSMKLQSFGGILLGQIYLDESSWEKAEEELTEAILASLDSGLKSQRFYQAYLQLGMATYYQQKWCLAAKSWEKAKILANEYQINFPEQLAEPLEYAQSKI